MTSSVLLVEDEAAIAFTLGEILSAEGYRVEQVAAASEALSRIDLERFDAAVLDLRLGEESGLSVLSHLRQASPDTAILILTGFGSVETAVQALRNGATDYLLKPCDVEELKAAVARGIKHQQDVRLAAEAREVRQDLERGLQARDRFVAVAAHELRTPLSVVLGWAQYLHRQLAQGSFDGAADRLEVVVAQARRLARLIEGLIDVVRIEQGTLALRKQQVDLRTVAERTAGEATASYPDYCFRLELSDEPVFTWIDAERVGEALANLLDNAAKFSSEGAEVCLAVGVIKGQAAVSVRDEGIGIPPEELANIFDRFYQAESDVMARRFPGMGVGLYVTRAIVEAHGGQLRAESRGRDQGSTFTLLLPLAGVRRPS